MYTLKNYVKAQTVEQALSLLQENRRNVILGGNMWLRMGNASYHTGIDLSDLGLDTVESDGDGARIGAMATLSVLRDDPLLDRLSHGAFRRAVSPIVGTQFQNMATVGGSLFARFGFSDINTLLLAMNASAEFAGAGIRTAEDYLSDPANKVRDILVRIRIPGNWTGVAFADFRNTSTDLPVLNCACACDGDDFRIVVGARPQRCMLCPKASLAWKNGEAPETVGKTAAEELVFGTNTRAGAAYRQLLCEQLVAKCVKEASLC